jgi:hypothetical protein
MGKGVKNVQNCVTSFGRLPTCVLFNFVFLSFFLLIINVCPYLHTLLTCLYFSYTCSYFHSLTFLPSHFLHFSHPPYSSASIFHFTFHTLSLSHSFSLSLSPLYFFMFFFSDCLSLFLSFFLFIAYSFLSTFLSFSFFLFHFLSLSLSLSLTISHFIFTCFSLSRFLLSLFCSFGLFLPVSHNLSFPFYFFSPSRLLK